MSKLRTLAKAVSTRPGQAALAVALILNASAAFAEGDRAGGRQLVNQALTEQARLYDEPQNDTVLTDGERSDLRNITREIRSSIHPSKMDYVTAAAVDLISTAGMVSRHRADADASLRMVLASTSDTGFGADDLSSVLRDMGYPLRFDAARPSTPKFEVI